MARRAGAAALAGVLAGVLAAVAVSGCGGGQDALPAAETGPPRAAAAGPPGATPAVRFAVKGDWGYGGPAQAAVTRRMCREHTRRPFAFILTTGDNFYRPDGRATAANFRRPEACLLRAGVRWRAAWGNHDLGGDDTARILGATRRWYTFADGPLRVVVLDANRPEDPTQLAFLRRVLSGAREPVRVVAFHQPAYTLGIHRPGETQQRLWAPLFRRHGVALVLQGHNHAYERLVVDDVTYITTGGGGAPVYPCVRISRQARACNPVHHFLTVDADATGLRIRSVRPSGALLEDIRLPARPSTGDGSG